jgi:hypothetical protein
MSESDVSHKWIEAGYKLFAESGPKEFKVEKLAQQIGMNKSGFYHYFVDRDLYYSELMKFHDLNGVKFAHDVSNLKNFIPGYPLTLIKYSTELKVHMQLRQNLHNPLFKEYFLKVKNRNYKYQIPLWASYLQLNDIQLATDLFEIAVDLMVVRLVGNDISYDFLEGLFGGIKHTIEKCRSLNKLADKVV